MKVIPKLSAAVKRYSLLAIASGMVWLVINPEISTGDRLCIPNLYAFGLLAVGALLYLRLIISDLAKGEKGHRVFRALQGGFLAGAILLCAPVIICTLISRKPGPSSSDSILLGIITLSIVSFFIFLAIDLATRGGREAGKEE